MTVLAKAVRSFVHPDRYCYHDVSQTAWTVNETYSEYSLFTTDDLVRFWKS